MLSTNQIILFQRYQKSHYTIKTYNIIYAISINSSNVTFSTQIHTRTQTYKYTHEQSKYCPLSYNIDSSQKVNRINKTQQVTIVDLSKHQKHLK